MESRQTMATEIKGGATPAIQLSFPMDVIAIQKCIPHRFPFLFVDRVLEAKPFESITAIRTVSASDPILQGHFPGNPILPGVVLVEGAAQVGGLLGYCSLGYLNECLFTEITNTRFRRPVVPGDVVRYEVQMKKYRLPFFWFEAQCLVEDQVAVTTTFSAMMK
jgi:beta-hydroxyacyl-ACP dehydratase FabZ